MSNEPGLTLGRLVAAERNAMTALTAQKDMMARLASAEAQIHSLHARIVQQDQTIASQNARIAMLMGNGATG